MLSDHLRLHFLIINGFFFSTVRAIVLNLFFRMKFNILNYFYKLNSLCNLHIFFFSNQSYLSLLWTRVSRATLQWLACFKSFHLIYLVSDKE